MASYSYLLNTMLIGDLNVGKSSILLQLTDFSFNDRYNPTIGVEFRMKILTFKDYAIRAHIWDASGNENFRNITKVYYRGVYVVLLVYDVTNRNSFKNLHKWIYDIKQSRNNEIVIILVGNKSDLVRQREVSSEDALLFSQQNGLLYIETSALTRSNIDEAFMIMARQICENKNIFRESK